MNKTSVKILHSYGKGNGCTCDGVSEHKDYLTIAWGVGKISEADTDLVLCDGTNGKTEPIQNEEHLRSVIGSRGGYVKAVVVKDKLSSEGKELNGPMNGGNYATDANGMSILKFPVPIHDRFESFGF